VDYLGLHNKPKTAVHPERLPTGHMEEEEEEEKEEEEEGLGLLSLHAV
jgi:hypothetical protein